MSDRTAHKAFVDALLTLEDEVSEGAYAAYRRRLKRLLEAETPAAGASRPRRFRGHALLAAAALLLAMGIAFSSLRQASVDVSDGRPATVVLAQRDVLEEKPYADVVQANLVALVRTAAPFRQHGATVYPLRIERVLKDETRQPPGQFCCEFREKAEPGEQYLACISQKEGSWSLNSIARVDDRYQREHLPGVERCVQILAASRSSDAAHVYQQLLAAEAGGVDEPAGCVLACRPDPRSAGVLLAKLQTFHDQLRKGIAPAPTPLPMTDEVVRAAAALESLHEPRAAELVAECARLSLPGQRASLYQCLPGLCRKATAEVRNKVQRLLQDEIDERHGRPDDVRAARDALARIALAR